GLVNRHPWKLLKSEQREGFISVTCVASFRESSELYKLFPFDHQLYLTIEVREGSVKWSYTIHNHGKKSLPFGFALHPYFIYQGERSETFLTIPATHMMESEDRMPTGKLIASEELEFPLGKPMSLEGKDFDDVFWGMNTKQPTTIDFRDVQRKIQISTSEHFTHLVVWTPERNYFGIESQTCSTDAHNLHAAGKERESHLQICPPEETMSAWVEYKFEK
ncbi:MAG: aldose 1-epimerase, partial [Planctomycetota bacterium]